MPRLPPTNPPTSECIIELDTSCVIGGNSSQSGQSCDVPTLGIEPCLERPTGATMLYNGGGCEQSDNTQELKFTCQDMNGGPPIEEGAESFIVVTDIKGNGITYFSGLVGVGETFPLNDNNERFEADMFITISTPDQGTVLQMVQFHSSCSSNLELKNRFGASQLVEFVNSVQGVVSCFVSFSFSLEIIVPIEATTTEPIILTSLTAMTNFAGDLDLTDQVEGQTISPGSAPVIVTLEGTIDASTQMRYTLFFNINGNVVATGQPCTGMDMLSFLAGNEPGARLPAGSPTGSGKDGGSAKDGSKKRRG